ncbi:hypothetical protein MKX01_034333 [Papaver californicum]|nr:hypothetical protein MKX01_034333 [Papaver californicum]
MGGSGQFTLPYYDAEDMILGPAGAEVIGTEHEVSIEVVEMIANSLVKKVESGRSLSQVVSIGPFHCQKENLKSTEECKLLYVHDLLCRKAEKKYKHVTEINNEITDVTNNEEEIEEEVKILNIQKREKMEELVRKYSSSGTMITSNRWLIPLSCECYSEPIMLKNNGFVEMMVIDGLFIIELLQRCAMKRKNFKDDPLLGRLWVLSSLTRDLLLLENQLPMVVLTCLSNLTSLEDELEGKSLNTLVLGFFNHLMPKHKQVLMMHSKKHIHESKHLLNLIAKTFHPPTRAKKAHSRWKFIKITTKMNHKTPINSVKADNLPWNLFSRSVWAKLNQAGFSKFIIASATHSSRPPADVENAAYASSWKYIPSVTELKHAGVSFKKGSTEGSVLDIKFNDGVLIIPPIIIQDKTDLLFRNIIAYEQCQMGVIYSAQDVEMIRNKGIITNTLCSDEDVSNLFNKLCRELIADNFYYFQLRDQVNDYYKRRRHFWKTIVKRDYCNNPCQVLSLVAGFLLIVLTFTGSVFAILSSLCSQVLILEKVIGAPCKTD